MDTIKISKKKTLMVAHRGVSGLEKENSMPAFIAAGNRSHYGVETDVHRTADGKFIILHDSDTKRVAGVACNVERTAYDVVRNIKLLDIDGTPGRCDLGIPSLEEYVRICKKYGKICVLEIKTDLTEEETASMIDVFKANDYLDGVIFISFGFQNLLWVKKIDPSLPAQYLFGEYDEDLWDKLVENNIDIDVHHSQVTKEFMEKAHSLGLKVNCWTVDNPDRAHQLVDLGVDYITSNILE